MHEKIGMSAAALHFRKSAAILVYEKKGKKWRFVSSVEASPYLYIPQEITIFLRRRRACVFSLTFRLENCV